MRSKVAVTAILTAAAALTSCSEAPYEAGPVPVEDGHSYSEKDALFAALAVCAGSKEKKDPLLVEHEFAGRFQLEPADAKKVAVSADVVFCAQMQGASG
ncbi:hypothetical protein [Streptomyces lavendulae]